MAQRIADRRDIDFVLHEQMRIGELSRHEAFAEFDKKTVDMIVTEARRLAIKEILPTQQSGDREGCAFENGTVTVPKSFHRAYHLFNKGEWLAMTAPPEWGGQGMPTTLGLAAGDYFCGANYAFMIYPGLGHGAARLIHAFGTDKQKQLFLRKMFSGEWGGTMVLTEPQAGSDVGALTTSAVKNDDGTYSISGNKIFISGGEHDLVKNIIHPVLARIEGAPPGTKGISLFIVPKIWVNHDGTLGEPNDVVCTGIEKKMGIHGNATCSMSLGTKGQCRGLLLGEENKGMHAMFLMMNEARLLVGMQGFGCASASYVNAVNYARERIQGKNLLLQRCDPKAPSVPIIDHPDVRRQLLTMKVYVEGMRSLLYYVGRCEDRARIADTAEEKARYRRLVEVLIPIAKGYVTDKAFEVCSHGIQVFGGYGYVREYPQEQLLRDCRITMIYEGTNGIQAMDLLGRKLGMARGKPVMELMEEAQRIIMAAKDIPLLNALGTALEPAVSKLSEIGLRLAKMARSLRAMNAFAFAHPFMDAAGDVVMAWMLLWRAVIAAPKLEMLAGSTDRWERKETAERNKVAAFYEGQVRSAEFFICSLVPVTMGKLDALLTTNAAAVEIPEVSFGG